MFRKVCTLFGWSLEKTDLQYLLDLNEPCFVRVEAIPDAEEMEIRKTRNKDSAFIATYQVDTFVSFSTQLFASEEN